MKLPDFRKMRGAMIDSQLKPSGINDPVLIAAIKYVPREIFVPAKMSALAYRDEAIEVVPGRYLLAPLVDCRLIAEVAPQKDDHVLVIGGTTGYSAAILARLTSHVTLLENDSTLVRRAGSAIAKTAVSNFEIVEGPLPEGHRAKAPYDIVLIDGCVEDLSDDLIAQVKDGGRIATVMAKPGASPCASIGRISGGYVGWTGFMEVSAPVLPGFERAQAFQF